MLRELTELASCLYRRSVVSMQSAVPRFCSSRRPDPCPTRSPAPLPTRCPTPRPPRCPTLRPARTPYSARGVGRAVAPSVTADIDGCGARGGRCYRYGGINAPPDAGAAPQPVLISAGMRPIAAPPGDQRERTEICHAPLAGDPSSRTLDR